MNKNEARRIAKEGGKTRAELKAIVSNYGGGNEKSKLNPNLSKSNVAEILRNALNTYPEDHVFKSYDNFNGKRDVMLVQNILRECG